MEEPALGEEPRQPRGGVTGGSTGKGGGQQRQNRRSPGGQPPRGLDRPAPRRQCRAREQNARAGGRQTLERARGAPRNPGNRQDQPMERLRLVGKIQRNRQSRNKSRGPGREEPDGRAGKRRSRRQLAGDLFARKIRMALSHPPRGLDDSLRLLRGKRRSCQGLVHRENPTAPLAATPVSGFRFQVSGGDREQGNSDEV